MQTTYSWLSSRISLETKIHLAQKSHRKKRGDNLDWDTVVLRMRPRGKELGSAKWTASYQRAGIFSYAYKKKCVNIFNMLNLLNLLSKRKCFIESLTSSTREERAAGLHNKIIILPSKKQGGHYFCNSKKNYNRSEIEKAGSPQKVN